MNKVDVNEGRYHKVEAFWKWSGVEKVIVKKKGFLGMTNCGHYHVWWVTDVSLLIFAS